MPAGNKERHRTERIGWLRATVLGANDGILSTSSLVLGVAAAHITTTSANTTYSRFQSAKLKPGVGHSPMTKHPNPSCVVKVGGGRGFVIERRIRVNIRDFATVQSRKHFYFVKRRFVVTAAHCLPELPPAHACPLPQERIYPDLLRSLDGTKSKVWSVCFFADPVADIAVLG